MSSFDHPVQTWYPGLIPNRAFLNVPVNRFVVHYIGAGTNWPNRDPRQHLRSSEERATTKLMYSSRSDWRAETWGHAENRRAHHAACGGHTENSIAIGHQALVGLDPLASLTDAQLARLIDGIRRGRQHHIDDGNLTPNHTVIPHGSTAAGRCTGTACPGPVISHPDIWSEIAAPLTTAPPPEDPMKRYFRVNNRPAVWGSTDGETAVRVDLEHYNALGKPPVENLTTAQARRYRFVDTIDRGVIV